MAQPTTARPGKMRIIIDGEAPCGLTTKGLTITKNLAEVAIPDCDDPDAPFWMARDVETMSASISGEGVMAAESEDEWNDAALSTEAVPTTVEIEFATGTRRFLGQFHLESFGVSAAQGQRVSVNISMQSDGQVTSGLPFEPDASLTLPWADGDYTFRLAIGQLRELQEKVDAGPMEVWRRLQDGTWRVDDISQPIRLGLIGGGLEPAKALKLVRTYVEERPLLENVLIATAVLGAAILGVPEEDAQKKTASETKTPTPSRAGKSDLADSIVLEPS